jgi:6-phosphogluconolactonase
MKYTVSIILIFVFSMINAQQKEVLLVIGTYTNTCKSDGIYLYRFDTETAQNNLVGATQNVISPSFLSISDDKKFIYSVNEDGEKSTVSAFSFDADSKNISLLNRLDSHGASSCYIVDDACNVIAANYSGGTIAVFGKSADGSLADVKQVVAHNGSGPNRERQKKAHVHMAVFSPDHKYVIVNDLGTDEISVYDYNPKASNTVLVLKNSYKQKAGSGPRHLAFSPDGKFVYLLHELDGTLTTFSYSAGILEKIHETTVVQKGFNGKIGAADIHASDDGKFLYATNRGDANTISVFALADNGKPSHIQTISTKGKSPRNFAIAPGGKFVLVAHQDSNDIVIFGRDERTGKLQATGKSIQLCSPVCLKFVTP